MMKEEKEDLINVAGDEGGVCTPQELAASGVAAGIKVSGNPDMTLIINQGPKKAATAVFTVNRVQVASVTVSEKHIVGGKLSAVVLNSGNADTCNGQPGIADALEICQEVADGLGVDVTEIGICSTGLIGDRLPMNIVLAGVPKLYENPGSDAAAGMAAAGAVLITGLMAKQAAAHGDGFTVGAMDKGVGITSPSVATTLGVITTDASVSTETAHEVIAKVSEVTFDHLDIDGSISINDTVIILANGASDVKPSQEELGQAVLSVCDSITRQMQSDAGDVTKRVPVTVCGTGGTENALVATRIIGRNSLFKCAMLGSDSNQDRMPAAVGTAPVDMDLEHITVSFNGHMACRNTGGAPDARGVDLSDKDIAAETDLDTGNPGEATIRTTDLSHDCVHINSAYSL